MCCRVLAAAAMLPRSEERVPIQDITRHRAQYAVIFDDDRCRLSH